VRVERVAFLASEYPPRIYGGLGTVVDALSRSLAAEGVDVVVFVPAADGSGEPPSRVELHPVPVESATSYEDFWLSYSEAAGESLRSFGRCFDVVHCHDWMTVLGGLAARPATQTPVVLTVHLPQTAAANLVMENVGLLGSDGVVVNSRAVRAELLGRGIRGGGAREGRDRRDRADEITVIPNGVDLTRFSPREEPPHQQQVLFVGRLVPQKAVDVLTRAFGAVLRRHPAARLVVAGDGDQRLYLERLARFLGVRQHVDFLGWRSPDELTHLYRSSAVTAVPSLYEPFGLVALEAMASGCPVVVGQVGGLTELVEDGVSGFMVEPGDHLGLAARLAALLSDRDLAHATGLAARRRAEHFDWATTARRTIEHYESLVARPVPATLDAEALAQVLAPASPGLRSRVSRLLGVDCAVPGAVTRLEPDSSRGRHGR
jgi:glycosyltransferase involved in cell wall biosynthesis